MRKISIITPMHNSFALMISNLKVLETMPVGSMELIIVDDCSTDGSYEKAVQYADSSSLDIKILKNEKNAGPGVSRNRGIAAATGEYITFVDSDDYVCNDFLKKLNPLMEQNIDCIIFDYTYVTNAGKKILSGTSVGRKDVCEGFLDNKKAFVYTYGSPWGKVYKKDLIDRNHIRFGEFFRNEDMPFTKVAIVRSKRIYYLEQELYNYVQVGSSLMHNTALNDEINCQRAFSMLSDSLADSDLKEELLSVELREVLNNSVMIKISRGCSNGEIREYIKKNYRIDHIHNQYFGAYPLYVKLISWAAYTQCVGFLRILAGIRERKKKNI